MIEQHPPVNHIVVPKTAKFAEQKVLQSYYVDTESTDPTENTIIIALNSEADLL